MLHLWREALQQPCLRSARAETIGSPSVAAAGPAAALPVAVPGACGAFGVLAGHTPLVAPLALGQIRTFSAPGVVDLQFAVSSGFVEVGPEKVFVTAQASESAAEIDVERASSAKRRAEKRLQLPHADDTDVDRAQAALARALNRLKLAELVRQS